MGYQFALDDFVYHKKWEPLIEFTSIIKIDVLNMSKKDIQQSIKILNGYTGTLLAEKIEDYEMLSFCHDQGFELFQGFYLNRPNLIKMPCATSNKTQLIKLINMLQNPNSDILEIEQSVLHQPKLSYQLLRLANTSTHYSSHNYGTIADAIKCLGLVQVKNWANMLLLASIEEANDDILERTLIRAKYAELLCRNLTEEDPYKAYTMGMFSTLEALFNQPMPQLLQEIQLSEDIQSALMFSKGPLGQILTLVLNHERGNYSHSFQHRDTDKILMECYVSSIKYAQDVMTHLLD